MVLLLLTGRCYEPEICAILLPLKYAFAWYRFLLSQSFQFLANIIVRGLIFANILQKECHSKGKRKEKSGFHTGGEAGKSPPSQSFPPPTKFKFNTSLVVYCRCVVTISPPIHIPV